MAVGTADNNYIKPFGMVKNITPCWFFKAAVSNLPCWASANNATFGQIKEEVFSGSLPLRKYLFDHNLPSRSRGTEKIRSKYAAR